MITFTLTIVQELEHGIRVYRVYAGSTSVALYLSLAGAEHYVARVRATVARVGGGYNHE